MIVDTMTIQDVCKAILSEKEYVNRFAKYRREDFIKSALKAKSFPFSKTFTTRTAVRKTEFKIKVFADSKNNIRHSTANTFAIYERPEGKYAAIVEGDWTAITIFPPHFFLRYRERELKDVTISMNEVIDAFFTDFWGYCDMWIDDSQKQIYELSEGEEDSQVNMVGAFHKGLILGFTQGNISLAKTFVSYDMLNDDQIHRFNTLIAEFDRLMTKIHGDKYKPLEKKH